MAPRLAQLAEQINREFPDLEAVIEQGYCCTDRKIPGTRLRRPGKGRRGNKLVVYSRTKRSPSGLDRLVVFSHNSAETYRRNSEVVDWIERRKKEVT